MIKYGNSNKQSERIKKKLQEQVMVWCLLGNRIDKRYSTDTPLDLETLVLEL